MIDQERLDRAHTLAQQVTRDLDRGTTDADVLSGHVEDLALSLRIVIEELARSDA